MKRLSSDDRIWMGKDTGNEQQQQQLEGGPTALLVYYC